MSPTRQKYIFLIPVMGMFVLALFILFGMSMNKSNSETTDYTTFSASVEVTELKKDRTHAFNLFSDGEITILDGYFFIEHKKYAGKILFDGHKSYLFRPEPNQAVAYSNKDQVIYGFLPPNIVINDAYTTGINITISESDESGFPVKYELEYGEGKSIVSFSNIVRSNDAIKGIEFALPEDTEYIAMEEYIQV